MPSGTHTQNYPIIISKSSGVHSPHLFLFPAYYHDVIEGKPKFRWYPTKNTMVIIGIFRTSVWWSVTSACVKNSLFVWFFSSLVVIHLNDFHAAKQSYKGSHETFPKREKKIIHPQTLYV